MSSFVPHSYCQLLGLFPQCLPIAAPASASRLPDSTQKVGCRLGVCMHALDTVQLRSSLRLPKASSRQGVPIVGPAPAVFTNHHSKHQILACCEPDTSAINHAPNVQQMLLHRHHLPGKWHASCPPPDMVFNNLEGFLQG